MVQARHYLSALLALFFISSSAATELVLSAPPRESPDVAEKTYGPLAKYLSEQLGQPVVYRQPDSWSAYSAALRKGEYDFVFDGPHFAAWRMVHLQHQPLVKLPGSLSFVVVTAANNDPIRKLMDLRSSAVCGMASPNLATNSILAEFGPVTSPKIVVIEGGYEDIAKAFDAHRCDAMILRDSYFKKLPEEKRKNLKVVYTSPAYANQTLTMGPRIAANQLPKLAAALASEEGVKVCGEIISRFADKNAKNMVVATVEEFKGNHLLLEGVVWGW